MRSVWPAALLLASTSRAQYVTFHIKSKEGEASADDRSVALWDKGMFGYNYPYQSSGTSLVPSPYDTTLVHLLPWLYEG